MTAARRLLSNADLCREAEALPPPLVGEVIDGVLYTMGRPSPAHARIEGAVFSDLWDQRRGGGPPPSGWYIAIEVEIRFANDEKAIPDLSGWRNERIAGHRNDNPIRITPDWVCEILSDSTRRKDLGPKRAMYARQGVGHLWIVDSEARQLEAFSLRENQWLLLGTWFEEDVADVAPFTGTPLEIERWWLREA